ncbi:hypothetical protein yc1106_05757 [Curvularia clavata]|uniref:Uncharacterized protein n=1 Tax=Curvularia clavata TaxID=95742 RepID=A0A9Q8ZDX9_CURCL|nr:hypothetical protein yc1106_05757 [Curvularia clavata]
MNDTDCITLSSRKDFTSYINLLRNLTNGDFSQVSSCRREVCGALWGSGNPDISGIGLAIGYLSESVICAGLIFFSVYLAAKRKKRRSKSKVPRLLLASAAEKFYDSAVFFCFAIQAASIVTLTRADFGISADGMGAFTLEIAWLVSSLTLLPLTPLVMRPEMFVEDEDTVESINHPTDRASIAIEDHQSNSTRCNGGDGNALREARKGQRFLSIVVCWAMGFGPFFSRMGGTFGESRIGNTPDTVISVTEWNTIANACFQDVHTLSSQERSLITSFGIISYLLLSVVIISKITVSIVDGSSDIELPWLRILSFEPKENERLGLYARSLLEFIIMITLVIQFWAFFRMRDVQSVMVRAMGESFSDALEAEELLPAGTSALVADIVGLPSKAVAEKAGSKWTEATGN